MYFEELREFEKDKKKLCRKYRSMPEDVETVKQLLEVFPDERPPFSYRINNLGIESCIIKVIKIACKSLKGKGVNSGLRLVYAYFKNKTRELENSEEKQSKENSDERERIVFIKLYHKSDKEQEDRLRIVKYFK